MGLWEDMTHCLLIKMQFAEGTWTIGCLGRNILQQQEVVVLLKAVLRGAASISRGGLKIFTAHAAVG